MPTSIRLLKTKLDGFRGITGEWEMSHGLNIFSGPTGSGKTTLADADSWLKEGKDSYGNAKFDVKTLKNGKPLKTAKHSVFNTYSIDGKEMTFGRVIYKSGKTNKVDYFVNGVGPPDIKAGNFDALISEHFSEKYKMCSDIRYVAEKMHWKELRELLISFVNDIDPAEVIKQVDGFSAVLNKRELKDVKALAEQRRSKINGSGKKVGELGKAQADLEANRNIVASVTGNDTLEEIESELARLTGRKKSLDQKILDIKTGDDSEDAKKLKDLNKALSTAENEFEHRRNNLRQEKNCLDADILVIDRERKNFEDDLVDHQEEYNRLAMEYKDLANSSPDDFTRDCQCITCGHEHQISEEKFKKTLSEFNYNKAEAIKQNLTRGKEVETEIRLIKDKIEASDKEKGYIVVKVRDLDKTIALTNTPEIENLKKQIADLKPIVSHGENIVPESLTDDLKAVESAIEVYRNKKSSLSSIQTAQDKIKELEKTIAGLVSESDKIERFFNLYSEYNKKLAEAIEKPVNSMFKKTRFRLFKELENGERAECCDILNYELKPYHGALSTGERIEVGCDIVKTLQKKFNLSVPVWIDNFQDITRPIDLDCQTIRLKTTDEFEELTKEV